jgi:cell division protein FtsL
MSALYPVELSLRLDILSLKYDLLDVRSELKAAKKLLKEQSHEITDLKFKLKIARDLDKEAERVVTKEYSDSCEEILRLRKENAGLKLAVAASAAPALSTA